jgi:hypothetical protein
VAARSVVIAVASLVVAVAVVMAVAVGILSGERSKV